MLSSLWMSGVEVGVVVMTGSLRLLAGGAHVSLRRPHLAFERRPIIQYKVVTRHLPGGSATFWQAGLFASVPRFYLDVLDSDQVIPDLEGIDFTDCDTAVAEAARGARDLVASGIRQNEDVSGQSFIIRDSTGTVVATVPFRATLPGRLRG
jgi:hypothetical protein